MRLFDPVLFRDGRPVRNLDPLDASDPAEVVARHEGHFAVHARHEDGSALLVRDLLGVHKLFFAVRDGEVESANYVVDLLRAGHPFSSVYSVPSGHCVRIDPAAGRYELARWGVLSSRVLLFERAPGFVCAVNLGTEPVRLDVDGTVLLASAEVDDGELPPDTAVWWAA